MTEEILPGAETATGGAETITVVVVVVSEVAAAAPEK